MFSIADLLERAKSNAHLESDYRLAKVLRINQTRLSNYRNGRSLPNVELIESLCALSGDDAGLVVAQVEAERAAAGPVRNMWLGVAKRLAGGAQTAVLSVVFAIGLLAGYAPDARASEAFAQKSANLISYTSYQLRFCQLLERLRRFRQLLPGFLRFCLLSAA